jgi:hypothetical protein
MKKVVGKNLFTEPFTCTRTPVSALVNVAPDPFFYLNEDADPAPDPGSQTNAAQYGSRSWSDFKVTKSYIFT